MSLAIRRPEETAPPPSTDRARPWTIRVPPARVGIALDYLDRTVPTDDEGLQEFLEGAFRRDGTIGELKGDTRAERFREVLKQARDLARERLENVLAGGTDDATGEVAALCVVRTFVPDWGWELPPNELADVGLPRTAIDRAIEAIDGTRRAADEERFFSALPILEMVLARSEGRDPVGAIEDAQSLVEKARAIVEGERAAPPPEAEAAEKGAGPVARRRAKPGDAEIKIVAALECLTNRGEWDKTESEIIALSGVPKSTYYRVLGKEGPAQRARGEYEARRLGRGPAQRDAI